MSQFVSRPAPLTVAAGAAAAVTAAGSLYLTLGMGLVACPLCFYQRAFALAAAGVLIAGLLLGAWRGASLSALALPVAVAGLAVALWHVSLEVRGKLECPEGLFELGTAPKQSAAAFLILTALLVLDVVTAADVSRALALAAGALLGAGAAAGCVFTVPPPPAVKAEEYEKPPRVCRPPQKAQT